MTELSTSPDRGKFQLETYLARCEKSGKLPNPDYIRLYESFIGTRNQRDSDMGDGKNDLECDLRSTDWILDKVRKSDIYAQNLYAAMCNREFQKNDVFPILAAQTWSCSWRHAGGIIADMQEKGDYLNWYCSGLRNHVSDQQYMDLTQEEKAAYEKVRDYVNEGCVTDEIEFDLNLLGWLVLDADD
jgi:hypothetical protein